MQQIRASSCKDSSGCQQSGKACIANVVLDRDDVSFQGSQGRAYLFNSVVNVGCGPAEERVLLTGLHAVADIYCENCKTTLGWKY
ncbi:Protein yippee-like 1, partial [Ameca splendens]